MTIYNDSSDEQLNASLSDKTVQDAINQTIRRHTMSIKIQKELAKAVLKEIEQKDLKPKKSKAIYKGLKYNDKGQFYSAIFEVELVIEVPGKGQINFLKDLQIPINIRGDMNIPEEKKEEKKVDKPQAETTTKAPIIPEKKTSAV